MKLLPLQLSQSNIQLFEYKILGIRQNLENLKRCSAFHKQPYQSYNKQGQQQYKLIFLPQRFYLLQSLQVGLPQLLQQVVLAQLLQQPFLKLFSLLLLFYQLQFKQVQPLMFPYFLGLFHLLLQQDHLQGLHCQLQQDHLQVDPYMGQVLVGQALDRSTCKEDGSFQRSHNRCFNNQRIDPPKIMIQYRTQQRNMVAHLEPNSHLVCC